jgi:hypothetical protein
LSNIPSFQEKTMTGPRYPSLYQVNTRIWLTELSRILEKRATLDDIPDAELDRISAMGFDWVWFLSVWETGPAAQKISRAHPEWRKDFAATLTDLREDDIAGSGNRSPALAREHVGSPWARKAATGYPTSARTRPARPASPCRSGRRAG